MDGLGQLRCFVRAAELGSFSAAAVEARIKPSSVSRAITELEIKLGAALFNRSTRRLHLTEVGTHFSHARGILEDLDDAFADAMALNQATRPAAAECARLLRAVHVLPYLPEFAARYPDIRLDITFTDALVDIIDTGTDLAIRTGTLADSRLIARKLAPHRRVVMCVPQVCRGAGAH